MAQTAQAVYKNGVLRPTTLLFLEEGQRVTITVEPIVELDPEELARREADFERQLEAEGMIEHVSPPQEPPPADWRPLQLHGEPLSETVIKMRR
jgi:predicted DNA-binding antitoxin AbrB/MazE fold protein